MIRDIKPAGDRLIYASGTEIYNVDREPQFFSQRVQTQVEQNAGCKNNPVEYRHIVRKIMNGHRRDVSCLDIIKGPTTLVASGSKDRKLIIWCFEVKFDNRGDRICFNVSYFNFGVEYVL